MAEPIWQQSVKASWMPIIVVTFAFELVLFAAISIFVTPVMWTGFVFVLALGVWIVGAFAAVNIWIDQDGIHVRYGRFGWPHVDIPSSEIVAAEVHDIRPMKWGGWGYRGSLGAFKRAAVVQRAGPGVKVDLTDGRLFAMTVDEPEGAVAAIERVLTAR